MEFRSILQLPTGGTTFSPLMQRTSVGFFRSLATSFQSSGALRGSLDKLLCSLLVFRMAALDDVAILATVAIRAYPTEVSPRMLAQQAARPNMVETAPPVGELASAIRASPPLNGVENLQISRRDQSGTFSPPSCKPGSNALIVFPDVRSPPPRLQGLLTDSPPLEHSLANAYLALPQKADATVGISMQLVRIFQQHADRAALSYLAQSKLSLSG